MPEGRLLIVKTGSTEPVVRARRGDFEAWICDGMGISPADARVVDVQEGGVLPDLRRVRAVVVTGSAAFVSDREPWSLETEEWLGPVVASETPVLGICYGHQLLAQALGGRVGPNLRGREIGTVTVDLGPAVRAADPLLGRLPEEVVVQATHVESVLALPPGALRLGSNAADENHAVRYGPCAWGVQFHPEFDADIMRGYLQQRADVLLEEGLDPARLIRDVRDSPDGLALLRRFAEIVGPARGGSAG